MKPWYDKQSNSQSIGLQALNWVEGVDAPVGHEVMMWEVAAADGRLAELLTWVSVRADLTGQVYVSAGSEARVVVIAPDVEALAGVPPELIARPAHAWPFRRVRG